MAQKRTHRHLFLKDLQTPPPNSGSAPKQETLTPRRRMTNVAEFQKMPAKESKKKLADAIRRKTFAAGPIWIRHRKYPLGSEMPCAQKTRLSTKKSLALKQTAARALLREVAALRVPALLILKVSSSLCCNDRRNIHLLLKSETVSWQSIRVSRRRLRISLRGSSDCRFKSAKGCRRSGSPS